MMLITACQNQPRVSGEYIHEWAANNVYPENQPRVSGEYLPPGIGRG